MHTSFSSFLPPPPPIQNQNKKAADMDIKSSSSSSSGTSSVEEVSVAASVESKHAPPPLPTPPPQRLQRLGSGGSAVIDPPEPGADVIESRKLPSSQYKGVVPQPNGRWGAQIYEKHQRVWLGTFNEEVEAARVYDVAAQRFRGRDAVTNFKALSEANDADAAELLFLNSHAKTEIVDMLRKHTYHDELQQSCQTIRLDSAASALGWKDSDLRIRGRATGKEVLFDKMVTPSDVGKLNRLVIPKQHAEKHFPLQVGRNGNGVATKGVLLNLEDGGGKVWRFRYSYWNSSQSYVLTKGWSRFVKEKNLRAGDIITFQRSMGPDRHLYIDWKPRAAVVMCGMAGGGGYGCYRSTVPVQPIRPPVQVVRLFGVNIVKSPVVEGGGGGGVVAGGGGGWNYGKRKMELELLPRQFCKKQCGGDL